MMLLVAPVEEQICQALQRRPHAQLHPAGHWVIRFPSEASVWELEVPGGATPRLPVRIHLVEAGSRRGVEASAQVPWHVYRSALDALTRADLSRSDGAEAALGRLLSTAFSTLAGALRH